MVTVDVAVLLAVIVFFLWRRPPAPRKRSDTTLTLLLVLVLGVLIAPTEFGQAISDFVGQVVNSVESFGT
ncbi:hypothetical protein V2W30_38170 [Streptomyces sp. Q6]|uniref:Uncharacterized protein n=1 Tax=Streptomyces citrinus TaxID=3118173 RepID=A0ACD5ANI6_9ACTN